MDIVLDANEIKRYLKVDKNYQNKDLDNDIKKAITIVERYSRPKYIKDIFDITIKDNKLIFDKTNLVFESKDIIKYLKDCDKVIVLVASLGLLLDKEIKKLEINDLNMAYIVNGVAVEYIEKYLDYVQANELKEYNIKTSRYSIGYGDLSLSYQSKLLNILNAYKRLGVSVLETNLMVPSKSVSAIIGVSELELDKNSVILKKCDNCLDNGMCSSKCIGKDD